MADGIRFLGASITDIVYTHETEGTFNVTKMLASLDEPYVIRARCPILESHREASRNASVHQGTLDGMTLDRAMSPLLMVCCENGTAFVADGNNRLRWLIDHGYQEFRARIIPYEHRERFRARIEYLIDGEWVEEDAREFLEKHKDEHHPMASTWRK